MMNFLLYKLLSYTLTLCTSEMLLKGGVAAALTHSKLVFDGASPVMEDIRQVARAACSKHTLLI